MVDTASGFLALSFQRLAKTADLSQVVEVSTDLKAWSTLTTEATIVDNGDGTERVTLRSETSLSAHLRQFIRLRVTQN